MKIFIIISITFAITSCSQKSNENSEKPDYSAYSVSLDSIMELDQGVRKQINEAMQSNSPLPSDIFTEMDKIDSSNQAWVIAKLDKYGWPKKSEIGEKGSRSIFLVIQHADLNEIEKYYPQLQALANENEASKIHAAMMQDRMLMYQGKKQIFGTQASSELRNDGSWVIWPVENAESINVRRKEVGFTNTVEESAASMNAIYNPEEPLIKEQKF
ncbi:DUF6624 domain-containing protein [Belliella kenyensis]|uniref:DUF6624 domain-containing protein n=1 Tax=Belliella kenyensis TaxID=1472724 RepID=A0ABV8EGQ8_9BACT|nr:DUF6624 domain-containing protein [Belliella kenyensis]MCH7402352.1 hypothetical protein [Belliella kenyensis]MDN3603544.1 hypothetical protein [Belliella kenyensis]